MVGVPGRSKACNTCRLRKIKCSYERPRCAQCVKSSRICAGYQRQRIFISNGEDVEKAVKDHAQRHSRDKQAVKLSPYRLEDGKSPNKSVGGATATSPGDSSTSSSIAEMPHHAVYRHQLMGFCIQQFVPLSHLESGGGGPWLIMLLRMSSPTKALEMSSAAVSTAQIGRASNNPRIIQESLRLYTQGLVELQRALKDPELIYADETLATCMVLLGYETMECPAGSLHGYLSHQDGSSKLIKLRGPEAHTESLAHHIFVTYRKQAILHSLSTQKRHFLLDPCWTTVPWSTIPKTPMDRILDYLALVPSIWRRTRSLEDLPPGNAISMVGKVTKRCIKLENALRAVFDDLERETLGPLYWPEFATTGGAIDDPELEKVFPIAYRFTSIRVVATILLYWATLLLLWSEMRQLHGFLLTLVHGRVKIEESSENVSDGKAASESGSPGFSPDEAKVAGVGGGARPSPLIAAKNLDFILRDRDFINPVRDICQSVEYCVQEDMRVLGPTLVVPPLIIAAEALKTHSNHEREMRWARAALDRIRRRKLRILKYF